MVISLPACRATEDENYLILLSNFTYISRTNPLLSILKLVHKTTDLGPKITEHFNFSKNIIGLSLNRRWEKIHSVLILTRNNGYLMRCAIDNMVINLCCFAMLCNLCLWLFQGGTNWEKCIKDAKCQPQAFGCFQKTATLQSQSPMGSC